MEKEIVDRIASPEEKESDRASEMAFRPKDFTEYIGQERVVKNVELMVESAKKRGSSMDHLLLSGPPGLGKTSLAMIIANSLQTNLHVISGPALERKGDLAAILTNFNKRDVLFIDEIHRIHVTIEEMLYSVMEDFRLDIVIGQGAGARTMQINIPEFTLIGATTRSGLLSNPLRDRFQSHLTFDYYAKGELEKIVVNNSKKMNLKVEEKAIKEIASRSRGTPRIANRILRRVRDFAVVHNHKVVDESDVKEALKLLDIDELGLDNMDRKILKVILDYYSGGPVGIDAIAATLGEDRGSIEDVYEPYLLKEGFLVRTPRGRAISDLARKHIQK